MSKIDNIKVRAMGGVATTGGNVSLKEQSDDMRLYADGAQYLTVDEARHLANDLRKLARRIEKRAAEPRPEQ